MTLVYPPFSPYKGLLLSVVLCCLWSCQPSAPTAPDSTALSSELGSPLPDPLPFFQQGKSTALPPDTLSRQEIAQLQAGDVILRRGYGLISNYILATLQETFPLTHCGLLVAQADGSLGVLHTASDKDRDGTLVEPLKDFVRHSQAQSLVACRPKATLVQRQRLLNLAEQYRISALPFDYSFDDQDARSLYCVELLRDLFLAVFEQDYLPLHYKRGHLSLLGFHNFFDSTTFTPLFNHCELQ